MLKISFFGAAETVTGSCYLVEDGKSKFLIDCGLFQGPDVYERNYEDFDFVPSEIEFVILTHAHMDHSGLLPKLVRKGFTGKIFLTPPSAQLAEILLLDAAKIQESNFRSEKEGRKESSHQDIIYTTFDSLNTIASFVSVDFDHRVKLSNGSYITFIKAGHILGAASVLLEIGGKKLVFSGDLGRIDEAIIEPFTEIQNFEDIDYVIMESLYGGVTHQTRKDAANELIGMVKEALHKGGNVVIPSFAVQKTQELLAIFKQSFASNLLPNDAKIVLDSPLAMKATVIYENNPTYFQGVNSENTYNQNGRDLFRFSNLNTVRSHKQSMKAAIKPNSVFIAGSGMAEGGRVVRHLINNLPGSKNTVIFVGYQAEGTKGRELLTLPKSIILDGKSVDIRATINRIEGFSSHADNNDLLVWLLKFAKSPSRLKKVFLTHADPERSEVFAEILEEKGYSCSVPKWKEVVELE